ncbi:nucleoside phosphorylase [Ruminococcus albus]|uniref:Uridine phosphorylase n=1 Tax=Ruminococcus albus TaxID=1264 RepID=A0A1I1DXX5_RUMAL|nr:nucleoside phosphorylase [Ruminococcus albus]SFB79276.1 Phosphorylase superfamily protein [Ruminococcus albus]
MSILDTFDGDGEEILRPDMIFEHTEDIPKKLISVFNINSVNSLLDRYDCAKCSARMSAGQNIPIYSLEYKGEKIGFYLSPIGSAASVGIMEEIAFRKDKKLLFFGSCGSLDKDISSGKLLIPAEAYRDEGTSYHYAPPSDYIKIKSADRLAEVFDEINVPYCKTKIWTTDAFYRETKRNMLARKAEGCSAVDMECSALMACAQFRGYEVYEFVYAADCLDGDEWDMRILGNGEKDLCDMMTDIALETIIRL